MRNLLLFCLLLGVSLLGHGQTAQTAPQTAQTAQTAYKTARATAQVSQVQGKLVFCFSEPLAPYQVAFRFTAPLHPHPGLTLADVLGQCLAGATATSNKLHKPYEAVIIQEGGLVAITFAADVQPEQRALATVPRLGGVLVYVGSEPSRAYHVALAHPVQWESHDTPGVYYTLGHVLENLLATAQHLQNPDAIIIGSTASYIKFQK